MVQERVIVAHPAQQHSYRTAGALAKADSLLAYYTTVYDKPGTIVARAKFLLRGTDRTRADSRRSSELLDSQVRVVLEWMELIRLVLQRIDKSKRLPKLWGSITSWIFARRVARDAIRLGADAVIMYDTHARHGFELLARRAPHIRRILDMSAPPLPAFREALQAHWRVFEELGISDANAPEQVTDKQMVSAVREIQLAHGFLSASSVTTDSLLSLGVPASAIHRASYGGGTESKPTHEAGGPTHEHEPVRFLVLGRVSYRKGSYHLLEALCHLRSQPLEVHFVGQMAPQLRTAAAKFPSGMFIGHVPRSEVAQHLCRADVLIFPSLMDGFGLAVLEALASGLPVICSKNAGMVETIQHGLNGLVIEPGSVGDLVAAIEAFIQDRTLLRRMSEHAPASVQHLTWEGYARDVNAAVGNICRNQS